MPLIDELNFTLFFGILATVLVINYFLFRKLLLALVDPLWFLVIINTSVTLTLVIYDRALKNDFFSGTVAYVCAAQFFFVLGAKVTKWMIMRNLARINLQGPGMSQADPRGAAWMLNMSTMVLLMVAVYYVATGLPSLASDPELARVQSRSGGGGMVTRVFNVFSYLSLTLWFYCHKKKIRLPTISSLAGILLPIFLLLMVGSKASLLFVYISLFYVSYYVAFESGRKFVFSARFFFITVGMVLLVSFVLLFARAGIAETSDSSWEFASFQLIGRIIFSGVGAAHYFSTEIPALAHLNMFDYLYQYIALPLLAPLRIFEYETTVGSVLAMSITGDDTFGPNPSMYVEGAIFFGRIFGVLYCAALGVVFSVFRYLPLRMRRAPSWMRVVFYSFGNMLIMSMTYDMILFIGDVVNFLLLAVTIIIAFVLVRASMRGTGAART